jgi:hypothetical protein
MTRWLSRLPLLWLGLWVLISFGLSTYVLVRRLWI